jgi:hypothetical protein
VTGGLAWVFMSHAAASAMNAAPATRRDNRMMADT